MHAAMSGILCTNSKMPEQGYFHKSENSKSLTYASGWVYGNLEYAFNQIT